MLCSIFFYVFVLCLSFIFSFILHPSCIIPLLISSFLSLIPFDYFVYSWQKGGEYIGEYTSLYRHFYMTHVHTLRGSNSTSCTFIEGESHRGDAYTKGEKTFFWENLVLLYAYFLVALWCFELCLVSSMFCCSHRIILLCPSKILFLDVSFPPSSWLFCLFVTKRGRIYRRVYKFVSSFLYDSCAHS